MSANRKSALAPPESAAPATEPVSAKGKSSRGTPKARSYGTAGKAFLSKKLLGAEERTKNHEKALKVFADPRLQEITRFTGTEDHFQRLLAKRVAGTGTRASIDDVVLQSVDGRAKLTEVRSKASTHTPFGASEDEHARSMPVSPCATREPAPQEATDIADDRPYIFKKKDPGISEARIAWEDTFQTTIKRLLVDFDLSEEANCRCHHLDRLHGWFADQKKKARVKEEGPSFLTLEHPPGGAAGRWPKGSPRNIDTPLSEPCVLLSSSMRMKKSSLLREAASRPLTAR